MLFLIPVAIVGYNLWEKHQKEQRADAATNNVQVDPVVMLTQDIMTEESDNDALQLKQQESMETEATDVSEQDEQEEAEETVDPSVVTTMTMTKKNNNGGSLLPTTAKSQGPVTSEPQNPWAHILCFLQPELQPKGPDEQKKINNEGSRQGAHHALPLPKISYK